MDRTRFSLATSYDDRLVEGLRGLPVSELYGKVEDDGLGGGRPRFLVPKVGWRRLVAHVAAARAAGIGFDYLLNAADGATGDLATPRGYRRLRAVLDRLVSIGVESVTVSSPFVLRVVARHAPALKPRVSVFARVDDERKARMWLEEGADRIVLDSMLVNRDPERLRRILDAIGANRLELLVNNRCENGCAFAACHAVDLGAASRRIDPRLDACFIQCQSAFLHDPTRLVMQDWVRPEDIGLYEDLGYRRFKIAGRGCATEDLLVRARAYAERRFDGNLMDLLGRGRVHLGPAAGLAALLRQGWRGVLGLARAARVAPRWEEGVWIENRALDGFLPLVFRKGGCLPGKCFRCDLCRRTAAGAVRLPADSARAARALDESLLDGTVWFAASR